MIRRRIAGHRAFGGIVGIALLVIGAIAALVTRTKRQGSDRSLTT